MFNDFAELITRVKQNNDRFIVGQITFVSSDTDYIMIVDNEFITCYLAKSFLGYPIVGDTVLTIQEKGNLYIVQILF